MLRGEQARIDALFHDATWLRGHDPALRRDLRERARIVRRGAGEWIYSEGDPATGLTIVLDGLVRIYCGGPGDVSCLIGQAGPGAILGQAIRFGGGPRLHSLVCATASTLIRISDTAIADIAAERPEAWRIVVRVLYAQLEGTLHVLMQTLALPPRRRIAARLLMMAEPGGNRIVIAQAELAEMLGLSRKTVNAHLGQMERAGLIRCGYGCVEILRPDTLCAVAETDRPAP